MNNLTATDKIQKIAEHIKANVLDPVEKEKKQILEEAKQEKARIIAEAEKEAKEIIESAESHVKELNSSTETALKIAAKQTVSVLKLSIEMEVLKRIIEEPIKEILNGPEILKGIIAEIVKTYVEKDFSGGVEVLVSKDNRDKLKEYVKNESIKKIKGGLSLSEESGISGCKVVLKGKKIALDFSDEALTDLLAQYIRPEIRSYLFQ